MTLKKRTVTQTAVAGIASSTVGLGAPYGRLVQVEVLDTGGDTSSDFTIVDKDSRSIFTIAAVDFTSKKTYVLTPESAKTEDGTDATGNAGFGGIVVHGPLTVSCSTAGTNVRTVVLFVEV